MQLIFTYLNTPQQKQMERIFEYLNISQHFSLLSKLMKGFSFNIVRLYIRTIIKLKLHLYYPVYLYLAKSEMIRHCLSHIGESKVMFLIYFLPYLVLLSLNYIFRPQKNLFDELFKFFCLLTLYTVHHFCGCLFLICQLEKM